MARRCGLAGVHGAPRPPRRRGGHADGADAARWAVPLARRARRDGADRRRRRAGAGARLALEAPGRRAAGPPHGGGRAARAGLCATALPLDDPCRGVAEPAGASVAARRAAGTDLRGADGAPAARCAARAARHRRAPAAGQPDPRRLPGAGRDRRRGAGSARGGQDPAHAQPRDRGAAPDQDEPPRLGAGAADGSDARRAADPPAGVGARPQGRPRLARGAARPRGGRAPGVGRGDRGGGLLGRPAGAPPPPRRADRRGRGGGAAGDRRAPAARPRRRPRRRPPGDRDRRLRPWSSRRGHDGRRGRCGGAAGGDPARVGIAPREKLARPYPLRFCRLLDEVVDHGGVGEGRGVAEAAELVLGDLAQDAAHDLAGARLGQAGRELDEVGRGDRADLLAHPGDELLAQVLARLLAGHQRDVGVDALALDVVRVADDRGLGDLRVGDERALDLGRAHAVAGDVDDVVDAAGDPVVAVGVAAAAVAGEVLARDRPRSRSARSARGRRRRCASGRASESAMTRLPSQAPS